MELFEANAPGDEIAAEFAVTRQRIHQWQKSLGEKEVIFHAHPDAVQFIKGAVNNLTLV